ncbi:unnamed protein product [Candidula unifasciata]|uniref:SHSP domain-containing protein n=1 Tax=Candidula unifasciata TaxID=100452 RepID=A0A8S3ZM73_9EUPU|nr:unnamed protein product [Candidula unifasciata]
MALFPVVPRLIEDFDPIMPVMPVTRWADDLYRWPALVNRLFEPLNDFGRTEVNETDSQICVRSDVSHFKPEEIHVSTDGKRLTIHAKHEEKADKYGTICREIKRSYKMPENADCKSMTSTMNSNGILNIKIPKKEIEKEVPIAVEYKK